MVANEILILSCIAVYGLGFLCGFMLNEFGKRTEKKMADVERCVCCGKVIPEGRQVCVICGYKADHKKNNYEILHNMSVEEMSHCKNICPMNSLLKHTNCEKADCDKCRMEFLTSEVDSNE